jgi:hypothetical protein
VPSAVEKLRAIRGARTVRCDTFVKTLDVEQDFIADLTAGIILLVSWWVGGTQNLYHKGHRYGS